MMSTNPKIKNEKISTYLGTNDSIDALEKAVNNGQTRLALDVIFDLLSEVTERLIVLEQSLIAPEQEEKVEIPVPTPAVAAQPSKTKPKEPSVEIAEEEKK